MFSSFWQQGKTKIGLWSALFICFVLLLEFLLGGTLFAASVMAPSLDLAPVGDLLGATGLPLVLCCIGIGIALARKWNKVGAGLILLTPVLVVLSGGGAGVLMLTNAATITTFADVLKHLALIALLLVCLLFTLLVSLAGGRSLWGAWDLGRRGVSVSGRIGTAWTHHLAQHEEDRDDYRAVVAFTTLAGEDRSIEISRSSRPYLPGGDLSMTYDPKRPSRAVEGTPSIGGGLGFCAGLSLYLFVCLGGLISFAYLFVRAMLGLLGIQ